MQLEHADDDEESHNANAPSDGRTQSDSLFEKMELLCTHVKALSASSQGYFKDQFLIEEYSLADQAAVASFQNAVETAKGNLRYLVTEVLDRFHEESLILNKHNQYDKNVDFQLGMKVKLKGWIPTGMAVEDKASVRLCVPQ